MKARRLSLLLVATLALAGCTLGPEDDGFEVIRRALTADEATVVSADNRFGLTLFQTLHTATPNENLFLSPLSVSMALGMTLNGADGETRTAMEAVLDKAGLTEAQINEAYRGLAELLTHLDAEVDLDIANSIWYRQGFTVLPEFLDVNKTYFDAEVAALDFGSPEALGRINGWVDEKTRGKIDKIITQIDPGVVMYLINAIYFKGAWQVPFDRAETREAAFHNADRTTTTVPMMRRDDAFLPLYDGDGFLALDLPYGDSLYQMTILLPDPNVPVSTVIDGLDPEAWQAITEGFTVSRVNLSLPRFKLEYKTSLVKALTAMGMGGAFTPGVADLSRINGTGGLWIDDVIHKTVVEVNEEGTEAAAVTAVVIVESLPPDVRIDRPFVFALRDRVSGTLLFIGTVLSL